MSWLFQLSVLSLLLTSFAKQAEATGDYTPPIEQDLPLVLIDTDQGLKLPISVRMEKTGLFENKEKIQFAYYDFTQQGFYCPAEDEEQRREIAKAVETQNRAQSLKEKIDENCLMKKIKGETKKLAPQCKKEPHPKIMKMLEEIKIPFIASNVALSSSTEIPCGSRGVGKMLAFGYQVCYEHEPIGLVKKIEKPKVHQIKGTTNVMIYGICYSAASNEVLFTTNRIKGTRLFKHYLLKKDIKKTWPLGVYNSVHIPHIDFEQVKLLLDQVTNASNFRIQLLVHPDDYPVGLWKKPAYHYANVNLIQKDLQQCWNTIHEKIKEYSANWSNFLQTLGYAELFTGAFRMTETGAPKTINHLQIPKIWVKVVFYVDTFAVAIIANNYREGPVDNIITASLNCKVNLCRTFIEQNFPNVLDDIRCCPLTDEIQALFGTTLKPKRVLQIKGVIMDEKKKSNRPSK